MLLVIKIGIPLLRRHIWFRTIKTRCVVIAKILILFLFRSNPLGSQIELLIDVEVLHA